MALLLFAISLLGGPAELSLRGRTVSHGVPLPSTLIVGRAVCGDTTWLLTDRPELMAVSHARLDTTVRAVKGFHPGDRPWGLACLSDQSLWTLATAMVLGRLGSDATVRERIDLPRPRLVLFGWADRLLFIELPIPIAQPLMGTSLPRAQDPSPWPRLFGRVAESRADLLARNLVNCGIGRSPNLPCWFADERRATISDGSSASAVSFAALYAPDVDPAAPIWDLAIGGENSLWLLVGTKAAGRGHKAGGRLVRTDRQGAEQGELRLATPARTILSATDNKCLLLSVDGTLVEVVSQ